MKIITTMLADEVYVSANEKGVQSFVDMRPYPEKENLSPVEHLLSSLAACGAVDIVEILKKRKKTIHAFSIETSGVRNDEPPRFFKRIHCLYKLTSPDVTPDEFEKAAALSLNKYCSVAASLKATITFSIALEKKDSPVS